MLDLCPANPHPESSAQSPAFFLINTISSKYANLLTSLTKKIVIPHKKFLAGIQSLCFSLLPLLNTAFALIRVIRVIRVLCLLLLLLLFLNPNTQLLTPAFRFCYCFS